MAYLPCLIVSDIVQNRPAFSKYQLCIHLTPPPRADSDTISVIKPTSTCQLVQM